MTDDLTDAVRRLKELQADVERLKAGDDQRGVPRLLFSQFETAVANDASTLIDADTAPSETAVARDRQTDLRFQGRPRAGYQSRARYGTGTYSRGERFERFESRLNVSLDTERELVGADVGSRTTVGLELRATSRVDVAILAEQSGTGGLGPSQILGNETFRIAVTDSFTDGQSFTASIFIDSTQANGQTFEEAALVAERSGGDLPINRFLLDDPGGLLAPKSDDETVTIDIEITQEDA